LRLPDAGVASVGALTSGAIATVVVSGRLRARLPLLWPECSHIRILCWSVLIWVVFHGMNINCRLVLVLLNSVFGEERLVCVIYSEACLILVRQQFMNILQSCRFEDLGKEKFIVCLDVIIGIFVSVSSE